VSLLSQYPWSPEGATIVLMSITINHFCLFLTPFKLNHTTCSFFLTFLLASISCTGGFHSDIYMCAFNISKLDSPPPSFSFSFPPSKNNFNRFHCSSFLHKYKVHPPYLQSSFTSPPHTHTGPPSHGACFTLLLCSFNVYTDFYIELC
jgi:hypothetical protein